MDREVLTFNGANDFANMAVANGVGLDDSEGAFNGHGRLRISTKRLGQ
jgi:hypothetical protein